MSDIPVIWLGFKFSNGSAWPVNINLPWPRPVHRIHIARLCMLNERKIWDFSPMTNFENSDNNKIGYFIHTCILVNCSVIMCFFTQIFLVRMSELRFNYSYTIGGNFTERHFIFFSGLELFKGSKNSSNINLLNSLASVQKMFAHHPAKSLQNLSVYPGPIFPSCKVDLHYLLYF